MSYEQHHTNGLILASGSSRRLDLLRQIGVSPNKIIPSEIDETQKKKETPQQLAIRLSREKAQAISLQYPKHYILAADTVVSCGQMVLDKPQSIETARNYLKKLSGRRHQVYGGISLITPENRAFTRKCKTLVQFKPLSDSEIHSYLQSEEWEGKAGGYAIQGMAGGFIKHIAGSYSNVVGLSLYDTLKILQSGGYAFSKKD